jgi:signal transduction histidine kinase
VKKIVLQHGGTITLRRSHAGGAAFIIQLPPADRKPLYERA